MKLKKGDKVKFLNDTGGGVVTGFINKDMVKVLNQDGFEVPILIEEILKEDEEFSAMETQVEPEPEEEGFDVFQENESEEFSVTNFSNPENEIYLALVPTDQKHPENSDLDIYFINDSDFHLFYLFLLKGESTYGYFASGSLEDNTKIFLKQVDRMNLAELNEIKGQFIFFKKNFFHAVSPAEIDIKLKPSKFFKSSTFVENDFFYEDAHVIELSKEAVLSKEINKLTNEEIRAAIQEKEYRETGSRKAKKRTPDSEIEEVDLHIEELVERPKDLSNKEMLEIQLDKFHEALQSAMKSPHKKKIVFIHGVGNGRLRYELRKSLDKDYPDLDYQDASFQEYGYGATLVFLRK
ncbi:MAG: DUF2027 domain-containing protein [Bacteroidota bacterium]